MEKTVCIITLSSESAPVAARMLAVKTDCASSAMIACKNEADFAAAATAERADVIFAAAEPAQFIRAKLHLIKALSCKVVRSSAVVAAMGADAPESAKERDIHAAMPYSAEVYPGENGLFSAFSYKKADGSTLVFLPLDGDTIKSLFDKELADYVAKSSYEEEKPSSSRGEITAANDGYNFKKDIEAFIRSGKSVAIADGGCCRALLSVVSGFEGAKACFISSKAEAPEDSSDETNASMLAKAAKGSAYTDYGASLSAIMRDPETGERFIAVALADGKGANLAKVYEEPGEDDKRLAGAAMIKFFEMLGKVAAAGKVAKPTPAAQAAPKQKKNKKSRLPLILALSGIAAAAVISAVVAALD